MIDIPSNRPYLNSAENFIYGLVKYAPGTDFEAIGSRLCSQVIPNLQQSGRATIDAELLKQQVNARVKFEQRFISLEVFEAFMNGEISNEQLNAYAKAGQLLANQEMPQATFNKVLDGTIPFEAINEVYEQ